MPLLLRRLVGTQQFLLDHKNVPKNRVLINPSVAGSVIYIRDVEQTGNQHVNHIILHNTKTNENINVPVPWDKLAPSSSYYVGVEDVRLCEYKNMMYFTCTCAHASTSMQSEMMVGTFSSDLRNVDMLHHIHMGAPPVKNVSPFVYGDDLMLLDMYNLAIYKVVFAEDHTSVQKTVDLIPNTSGSASASAIGDHVRGSTSPVHLHGNTWGCLVHDIIYDNNVTYQTKVKLAYMHWWVEFDVLSGQVTFTSSPFFLIKFGVEFVSGIEKKNDKIVLYLGVDDKYPMVVTTTLANLRA